MVVKRISPLLLRKEVKYIYVFEGSDKADHGDHVHLPDGTFDLVFSYGRSMKRRESETLQELPTARLVGGYTEAFTLNYPMAFTVIAIVFHPVYVSCFVPEIYDISNEKCVSAEDIFGEGVLELRHSLSQSPDVQSAVFSIESFLLRHRRSESTTHYEAQISRSLLLMDHGFGSISAISKEIGMSERNFRRNFKGLTGFSPQKMMRVKRVKKLSRLLAKAEKLNNAVVDLGYHDVSHMIHDFKSVTGLTPGEYAAGLDRIDQAFHYWN